MISVIIPTYNRGHIITRAIDSALRQTYRDFEIIVIDDGSTDNTRTVLEPYQDQIKYFYQENRGVTEARNKGIKESYGEFIAFLDSDDYWLPEKLEMQMNYFKNHPEVAMVYTRHWKEIDTGKNKIMPKKNKLVEGYIYKYLLFSSYIWMGAVMVRKDSLFNVGLLDHPLDKHMFLKIARKYNVGAIDKPLAVHYKVNTVYKGMKGPSKREEIYQEGFEALRLWEKILYFPVFQLKRSRHFASAGKKHMQEKQYGLSREYYCEALKRFPFKLKYWKGLLKVFVSL